ncbi:unnamed protein product, partial [Ceratitis capitata]
CHLHVAQLTRESISPSRVAIIHINMTLTSILAATFVAFNNFDMLLTRSIKHIGE